MLSVGSLIAVVWLIQGYKSPAPKPTKHDSVIDNDDVQRWRHSGEQPTSEFNRTGLEIKSEEVAQFL
jgi:ribosomal protein S16